MYRLTADQIMHFDEIYLELDSVEQVLALALRHAENRFNEIEKERQKWWSEIAAIHGLDLDSDCYELRDVNGSTCVVKADES